MFFVKPGFLKDNPDSIILDCRFEMKEPEVGPREYEREHIKGAVYVNLEVDMVGERGEHGGRHPLPDLKKFRKSMEAKGVSDDKKVVIYDDGTLPMAARLWYILQLIGKDSYIIEGGFDALKKANFITTKEIPSVFKGRLTSPERPELLATIEDVLKAIDDPDILIVDCRSNPRYLGIEEPLDKMAGHIPNAKNVFWKDLLDENSLKSESELKKTFSDFEKYKKVIFHCGSGVTGAVELFIYNELGAKATLYAGSFSDYISYKGNKLVVEGGKTIEI